MWPLRAEAGIVRRGHHVASFDHFPQPLHLLKHGQRARWRAARNDPGGRVRPRDDRASSVGRRCQGDDDYPGYGDRFIVKSDGAIEDAIGRGAVRPALHRLGPDERARPAGKLLIGRHVERGLRAHCRRTGNRQRRGSEEQDSYSQARSAFEPHGDLAWLPIVGTAMPTRRLYGAIVQHLRPVTGCVQSCDRNFANSAGRKLAKCCISSAQCTSKARASASLGRITSRAPRAITAPSVLPRPAA